MGTLTLKIVITPIFILAASWAGRRWGETVAGWLVGLPLTSGPIAFFLALEHGNGFAAAAAAGSLGGALAQACFCIGYGRAAERMRWPLALGLGTAAFAGGALLLQATRLSLPSLLAVTLAALVLAIGLVPRGRMRAFDVLTLPRWDIPTRMATATVLVIALTAAAPVLGPRLSGLLATFPVFAAVLALFAHRLQGGAAAQQVLRGLLLGLFAFAGFFFALGVAIDRMGIAGGFAIAVAVALAIQGGSLWVMRRRGQGRRLP
jgi:hypothetical protein